jgi:hypothetical protein
LTIYSNEILARLPVRVACGTVVLGDGVFYSMADIQLVI